MKKNAIHVGALYNNFALADNNNKNTTIFFLNLYIKLSKHWRILLFEPNHHPQITHTNFFIPVSAVRDEALRRI